MIWKKNKNLSKVKRDECEQWIYKRYRNLFRYGFMLYMILHSSFIILDYLSIPESINILIFLRLVIGIPILSIPIIITFIPRIHKHYLIINSLVVFFIPVTIIIMIIEIGDSDILTNKIYFVGIALTMSVMGIVISRWVYTAIFSLLILFIYLFVGFFIINLDEKFPLFFMYSGAFIFCFSVINTLISYLVMDIKYSCFLTEEKLIKEKKIIHSTNKKIKKQKQELEELNNTKDKFFKIIAHDLRSPFNSLLGITEIVLDSPENFSKEQLINYIGNINKASTNTYKLLLNLLEWASSQTGAVEYKPEPLKIKSILKDSIALSEQNIESKKIKLTNIIEDTVIVYADKNMLSTVIHNLLSNAIKFTYEGGSINISGKQNNKYLKLSISDSGVGIPRDRIKKLQNNSGYASTLGTNDEKGTGIGLLLCKEFIAKNNGKLWIDSEPGKGSTFSFSIPLADSDN